MTKKAKRIMIETYLYCKRYVKNFGYDGNGFNKMADSYNELIYQRTMNDMKEILAHWKYDNKKQYQYNIISKEEYELNCMVYDMIEKTMANQYIA